MNVLHVDEQRAWRGGEQQASYLLRGLVERGHHVVLAGRTGGPFIGSDHGMPDLVRVSLPCWGEVDPCSVWLLSRAITHYQIDVIHAHTAHAHTLASLARLLAGRGKVIVSRRVVNLPRNGFFSQWKYRQPDAYVAISKSIADALKMFGIPEAKIRTVYSAVDPERLQVAPLSRASLGIPERGPLIGNVAALVGVKDQTTLLAAMAVALRTVPALQLVIAGEGPLRPVLEQQIEQLGIKSSVTLLGYRNDVPRLLRALDGFVLSSKEEGLGTSILDAMACGLPVVATAAGGIPEMVRPGRTGFLVPAGDVTAMAAAMVCMVSDHSSVAELVENAKQMVQTEFAVESMIEGNLKVYEQVLAM